jgi:hypothetical protein
VPALELLPSFSSQSPSGPLMQAEKIKQLKKKKSQTHFTCVRCISEQPKQMNDRKLAHS